MNLGSRLARWRPGWLSLVGVVCFGCGARTSLDSEDEQQVFEPPLECLFDEECPTTDLCRPATCTDGLCRQASAPIDCDDGDECTADSCDPATGQCRQRELSFDQDGDGHKGPRAGYAPGAEGACGDDCDDTSAAARPGGVEVCDGVDNDCNGVVDDGAAYDLLGDAPLKLGSAEDSRSGAAGLAFDGERWGVTLWGERERREFRFLGISSEGELEVERLLTNHNGGSYGGPITWTGALYGTVWSDDRQGETIEVYFNRLDRNGDKLGPDLRLTESDAFSRDAFLRYNGSEFQVFWNDAAGAVTGLFVQRVSLEGEPLGSMSQISPPGVHAEFAALDFGTQRVGMAVESSDVQGGRTLNFMSTEHDFSDQPTLITIDTDPDSHHMRFAGDRFIVVWSQLLPNNTIGEYVYGASFDEFGVPLRQKTALTPGGGHARGGFLLPLGDRSLLFWSDDVEGNYEIYVKTIDNDLNDLSPPQRLTSADGFSGGIAAAFGPGSQIGVLFNDDRDGSRHAYMLRMQCDAGELPRP